MFDILDPSFPFSEGGMFCVYVDVTVIREKVNVFFSAAFFAVDADGFHKIIWSEKKKEKKVCR